MTNEKSLYKSTKLIWYFFYVVETLILFRLLLKLFGANPAAGFTNFIYTLSGVFMAPFRFVFQNNSVGGSIFEWNALLAMLVYWVFFWGIIKPVVMNRPIDAQTAEEGLEV
ncbi:MAG: YggT family protein [Candidatus Paceibacterota bacterium]